MWSSLSTAPRAALRVMVRRTRMSAQDTRLYSSLARAAAARYGPHLQARRIHCSSIVAAHTSTSSEAPTSDEPLAVDDGAGQWSVPRPGCGGVHDLGGIDALLGSPVDVVDRPYSEWERRMHAVLVLLVSRGVMKVDELRAGIEAMPAEHYEAWGYYDKWAVAVASSLLNRGVIAPDELDAALGARVDPEHDATVHGPLFTAGDAVCVKQDRLASRWRKPHLRVPGYVFGAQGVVVAYRGAFHDPEFLAFRGAEQKQHLYTVRFTRGELWPEYEAAADGSETPVHPDDTVDVDVYQSWLESQSSAAKAAPARSGKPDPVVRIKERDEDATHGHGHGHGHGHRHGHRHGAEEDHSHDPRWMIEQAAVESEGPERPGQRVAEALMAVLSSKGLVSTQDIVTAIERIDQAGSRGEGPRLVARAWVDDGFRQRLLADASAACEELGITSSNSTTSTRLVAVESTPDTHCLAVCTLCSCYPLSILGLSPPWYKSREYRARAVREPRELLADSFGLRIDPSVAVRVFDSTADLRYIVVPQRPAGTDGWTEEQLQTLVTRDSMIGVAVPSVPKPE